MAAREAESVAGVGSGNDLVAFNGVIDSIQLVPEPFLAALLASGALVLGLRRRG